MCVPEMPEGKTQPRHVRIASCVERPLQGSTQIVLFAVQARIPCTRLRPAQLTVGYACELQVGNQMTLAYHLNFAAGGKLLCRILAHQLMQVKTTLCAATHQRFVDQAQQKGQASIG